jgi:hypothetical protein
MFVIRMRFGTEVVPVPKNGMIMFGCWRFHHGPPSDGNNVINRFFFNLECPKTAKLRTKRIKEGKRKGTLQVEVVQLSAEMQSSQCRSVVPMPVGWNTMQVRNRPKDRSSFVDFYRPPHGFAQSLDWYGLTLDHHFAVLYYTPFTGSPHHPAAHPSVL